MVTTAGETRPIRSSSDPDADAISVDGGAASGGIGADGGVTGGRVGVGDGATVTGRGTGREVAAFEDGVAIAVGAFGAGAGRWVSHQIAPDTTTTTAIVRATAEAPLRETGASSATIGDGVCICVKPHRQVVSFPGTRR